MELSSKIMKTSLVALVRYILSIYIGFYAYFTCILWGPCLLRYIYDFLSGNEAHMLGYYFYATDNPALPMGMVLAIILIKSVLATWIFFRTVVFIAPDYSKTMMVISCLLFVAVLVQLHAYDLQHLQGLTYGLQHPIGELMIRRTIILLLSLTTMLLCNYKMNHVSHGDGSSGTKSVCSLTRHAI